MSCTPAERRFLDVVAEHGLGPGVGECQEAWGAVVEERERAGHLCRHDGFSHSRNLSCPREACKRCNDMQPEGFDADRLRATDAAYMATDYSGPSPGCAKCIGLSQGSVIDRIWRLDTAPTDALLRELARRFL